MNPKMIAVILVAMVLGGWTWAGSEDTNHVPSALRLELDPLTRCPPANSS